MNDKGDIKIKIDIAAMYSTSYLDNMASSLKLIREYVVHLVKMESAHSEVEKIEKNCGAATDRCGAMCPSRSRKLLLCFLFQCLDVLSSSVNL